MTDLKHEHDKNLVEFLRLERDRLRDISHPVDHPLYDFAMGQYLAFDRAYNVATRSNSCEWKVK